MSSENKRILGVNIDHVATVREVRKASYPDLIKTIKEVEQGGADFITAHLREDRRHIQDADVALIIDNSLTWLNLEVSTNPKMVDLACKFAPKTVCLVPEKRQELTTEGGLDVVRLSQEVETACKTLQDKSIEVSLFIDPIFEQIEQSAKIGAQAIELHTGSFANTFVTNDEAAIKKELDDLYKAANHAADLGLVVNCGHGLTLDNVESLCDLPNVKEYNIGHAIVADALFVGLQSAVVSMRKALKI